MCNQPIDLGVWWPKILREWLLFLVNHDREKKNDMDDQGFRLASYIHAFILIKGTMYVIPHVRHTERIAPIFSEKPPTPTPCWGMQTCAYCGVLYVPCSSFRRPNRWQLAMVVRGGAVLCWALILGLRWSSKYQSRFKKTWPGNWWNQLPCVETLHTRTVDTGRNDEKLPILPVRLLRVPDGTQLICTSSQCWYTWFRWVHKIFVALPWAS